MIGLQITPQPTYRPLGDTAIAVLPVVASLGLLSWPAQPVGSMADASFPLFSMSTSEFVAALGRAIAGIMHMTSSW